MYPLTYQADYVEARNRWTVGFRLILAIPWLILAYVYMIAVSVTVLLAWFALLFTGRYPQGLYNFNAGFLRFFGRFYGWAYLQTDVYPPFGFEPAPSYPVRIDVAPAQESYSRLKVFFRPILALPLYFVLYVVGGIHNGGSFLSWLAIVFTGRQPAGVHNLLTLTNGYLVRVGAYLMLMTETYPPLSNQDVAPTLPSLPAGQQQAALPTEQPAQPEEA
ncbi:MAG: hypothetical protein QOJ38_605 [Solirubrobacterales bacterium]|nr:hypothetical protein [Solirubrobacterales bacterium]